MGLTLKGSTPLTKSRALSVSLCRGNAAVSPLEDQGADRVLVELRLVVVDARLVPGEVDVGGADPGLLSQERLDVLGAAPAAQAEELQTARALGSPPSLTAARDVRDVRFTDFYMPAAELPDRRRGGLRFRSRPVIQFSPYCSRH
jgi:hypothetical protein